jgi:hypothetical protein
LLFLKPLGTFFNMILSPFFVNGFRVSINTFSSTFIWFVSKRLQARSVHSLWIKRQLGFLFWHTGRVRRLAIRPGAIGDFIVSLPALESLRSDYFEVWAPSPNVPLVRFADRVRSIASTGLDLLGIVDPPAGLIDELRTFDSIVSWYGANRPEFRELIHALGLPCRFLPALPPDGAAMHATDFYLDQVRALYQFNPYQLNWGQSTCDQSTCDQSTCDQSSGEATPRIRCDVPRGNFAAIHPFSGSARKNWPLEKFRQLARGLERTMPVSWCAGPDDPPLAGAVQIDDLYELACWLAKARLYVGNDSGITHLAAAVGTPVLALFGPTDPAVWAPRGPHVRVARWKA